jgi:predicted SnoaL-like aldol condensation-catalyzing enzyme
MSVEENKALVRRYFESGYREAMRGNLDVVHQYFADHYHDHTSLHPEHPGLEGVKELLSDSGQATPDLRREIVDIAAQDDLVFVHWRATATHEGQHQVHKQSG